MRKQNQLNSENVEFESLTAEIGQKSIMIAKLNAQVYKLAAENQKLKMQLKDKSSKSTKGKK